MSYFGKKELLLKDVETWVASDNRELWLDFVSKMYRKYKGTFGEGAIKKVLYLRFSGKLDVDSDGFLCRSDDEEI